VFVAESRDADHYTQSGGKGRPTLNQEDAVAAMLEKYEVCCGLFHGFDYATVLRGSSAQKLAGVTAAMDHALALNDGKKRLLEAVGLLSKAFALAVPHPDALAVRDEVAFFQAVRVAVVKTTVTAGKAQEDLDQSRPGPHRRSHLPDGSGGGQLPPDHEDH